jgi:DNA-binding XRE family transcriptional regulator
VLAILEAAEQRSANRKAQIMPSPVEEQQPVEVSVSTQVSTPAPVEIAALVQEQEQPPQIEVTKQQPVEIAAAPLLRLVVSNPEPEQLGLAFDAPAINVFALVEAKRRRMGISQREVAAELGLKQPGYANILRGHDKPSRWVTQRALDFLNDSKIAA